MTDMDTDTDTSSCQRETKETKETKESAEREENLGFEELTVRPEFGGLWETTDPSDQSVLQVYRVFVEIPDIKDNLVLEDLKDQRVQLDRQEFKVLLDL
jgi:hypothetical protein